MVTRLLEARFAWARDALESPARTTRTAVVVGRLLGLAFVVCFATGMYSHALQDPLPWMVFPTQPAQLYQWTQGLHVISGTAAIPLLLGKLWIVYPRLFSWPPIDSPLHAVERLSIAMLVAGSIVQVAIGFLNTLQWYPWEFSFRRVHLALGWVVIGSLAVHVGAKLPQIVEHWRGTRPETGRPKAPTSQPAHADPDANADAAPTAAPAPAAVASAPAASAPAPAVPAPASPAPAAPAAPAVASEAPEAPEAPSEPRQEEHR